MTSDKARTNAAWTSTPAYRGNHAGIFGEPMVLSEIVAKIKAKEEITPKELAFFEKHADDGIRAQLEEDDADS